MSKEGISCMYPPVHVMCIAATQGSPISDNSACHGVSAGISPRASPLLRLTLVGLMLTTFLYATRTIHETRATLAAVIWPFSCPMKFPTLFEFFSSLQ